jgi:DNA invertase Pin-like site-specific DNA recombinase
VETVRDLVVRGVGFKCLQESIDTTTSGGKLIFHIFASLAEFERDLIRERTNAGLSAARARGRKGGRPQGVDAKKQKAALALKKEGAHSIREICEIVGIARNTYYSTRVRRTSRGQRNGVRSSAKNTGQQHKMGNAWSGSVPPTSLCSPCYLRGLP